MGSLCGRRGLALLPVQDGKEHVVKGLVAVVVKCAELLSRDDLHEVLMKC